MGHSKEEKARSRERILEVAAERLRGEGIDGPGVADIMRAAGLTHGGFYKHFGSRDELVAEALATALDAQSAATVAGLADVDDPMRAFAQAYTSTDHCEHPEAGCGVAAVAGEVARGGPQLRAAYTERIAGFIDGVDTFLERRGGQEDPATRRADAIARYAMLVGGLTLARAVDDDGLRDEILAAVRGAASA